jgi:hypothetical protein
MSPPGPVQLVVEASKRNAKPLLLCLVERHSLPRIGERPLEANDVRHSALLYHDLHDFGELFGFWR